MAPKSEPKLEVVDPIAPVTVGDPAAAADLAIDQSHLEDYADIDFESSVVECKKPPKGIYFAARKEVGEKWQDRAYYFFLEIEGRDPYIVVPSIAKQKEEDTIRPALLVRCVTMAGEEFLWPIKLDKADGKTNSWNRSARNVLGMAEEIWTRMKNAGKHYAHQKSPKTFETVPPKFSERSFKELVAIAFKDRIIDSLDHEIWEVLESGSEK
jgi:hypothetical protein